jgi:multidrug efflux pump
MKLPRFFIDRPRFALVLSILVVLAGVLSYGSLPVSMYPEVAPPTITVNAVYPGADPETIAETVATPIEQEINGIEGMMYMESRSSSDGSMALTVTFELGTDIDRAQVQVQNRVSIATPSLPAEVRQIGVTTNKSMPGILLVAQLVSPDSSKDTLYMGNYAYTQLRDVLLRLDGVGNVQIFGGSKYAMRIWLDVDRLSSLDLTPGDVISALQEQNVQVAAGAIGKEPIASGGAFEIPIASRGRLREASEFEDIIVKRGGQGALVRLDDVARVELGSQDYNNLSRLDTMDTVSMLVSQRSGSNAVQTANEVVAELEKLSATFPSGMEYKVAYNPTEFVQESIDEVFKTLIITAIIVALTVFVFLQGWRATAIPLIAIPISLIGTFAVLSVLGLSLNSLSLFGLVLAIGIVVDDAIVVVENVDRLISQGATPKEAARKAMDEVGSALIATTLVLIAVFVPTAFLSGITGQFYRQFALTITASTAISTFVSLTLSPAMAAILLKPKSEKESVGGRVMGFIFKPFNAGLDLANRLYGGTVKGAIKLRWVVVIIFGVMLGGTYFMLTKVPGGFIPPQDQGYLIVAVQLPDGSSLSRTDVVAREVTDIALEVPGVDRAIVFSGFSGATFSNNSSAAAIFLTLTDAKERATSGLSDQAITNQIRGRVASIDEAMVFVIPPPPVPGIGNGGGFKMQIQDRSGVGYKALNEAAWGLAMAANQDPGLVGVFTNFSVGTPQLYADIDPTRARMLDVPMSNINQTLQSYLGSTFVNEFTYLGRSNRVTIQADADFRDEEQDILRLKTKSASGAMVPLGSLMTLQRDTIPSQIVRYNLYPAADVSGSKVPFISTGQSLDTMEQLASQMLPSTLAYEWTDLSYQEREQGNTAVYIFAICVLLVFLTLTAQYESWSLPLAIIMIVPLCILFGLIGISLRGIDNNILTQIGFILLVGLASKNAILIVEYASALQKEGLGTVEAAIKACRLRFRPILMTAFSFILGVIPLMFATGAGSEMRQVLGTVVFSGMLGITLVGLVLTPVFYVLLQKR